MCANYDSASRLTRAWTRTDGNCGNTDSDWRGPEPFRSSYWYNRLGNITSASGTGTVDGSYSYSSGHAHAPSSAGGNSYSYDAAGNRTKAVVGGQTTNSVYDVQGRLISTSGAVSTEHLYGAGGERARRTVNGKRSWYYRDGYELNSSSRATISITLNGSLVGTWEDATGRLWSQASDHLGSPTVAVSWSGQREIRRNTPFGSPRSAASTVAGGPSDLSFTGQRDDVGTGLMYYGARFYDPVLAQFTQPDLVNDGLNRYAYVANNPLSWIDPSGNFSIKKFGSGVLQGVKESLTVGNIAKVAGITAAVVVTAAVSTTAAAVLAVAAPVLAVGAVAYVGYSAYRAYQEGGEEAAGRVVGRAAGDVAISLGTAYGVKTGLSVALRSGPQPANPRPSSSSSDDPLQTFADEMVQLPKNGANGTAPPRPRVVAEFTTESGSIYYGRSGFSPRLPTWMQRLLNVRTYRQPIGNGHGRCAEIHCYWQALRAGESIRNGSMRTLFVRPKTNPLYGSPVPPCPTCAAVGRSLGTTITHN